MAISKDEVIKDMLLSSAINSAGGGGEVWEEVDLSNWPTDWVEGDRIKVSMGVYYLQSEGLKVYSHNAPFYEFTLRSNNSSSYVPISIGDGYVIQYLWSTVVNNNNGGRLCTISQTIYGRSTYSKNCALSDLQPFTDVIHILRLKK